MFPPPAQEKSPSGHIKATGISYSDSFHSANNAAGDLQPRIPGRLRTKIIRPAVDHHRPTYYILHRKPVCPHSQICSSIAQPQKRRHVPRVAWMGQSSRIIVTAGAGKVLVRTTSALVNMQGKEAPIFSLRQSGYIRLHKNTPPLLVKPHFSGQTGRLRPASYARHRIRAPGAILHTITSYHPMRPRKRRAFPFRPLSIAQRKNGASTGMLRIL